MPHAEGLSRAEAEERRVKEYEEATRQPNGSYRTYSFLIRCYKPEEDVRITYRHCAINQPWKGVVTK